MAVLEMLTAAFSNSKSPFAVSIEVMIVATKDR